jgi:DNA polymerase-3 subunit alpha
MYLSGNPLSEHRYLAELMRLKKANQIAELAETGKLRDGDNVGILCSLKEKKLHVTKKGDKMCFLTVEDETGEMDAVVFPDLFSISASRLRDEETLIINGRISLKDESVSIICGSIFSEDEFIKLTEKMKLCIKTTAPQASVPKELLKLCREFSGYTEVCFYLTDMRKFISPKEKLSLRICRELYEKLSEIYMPEQIGLIRQ